MDSSALLDMVSCGIVILNVRARILHINAHATEILRDNKDVLIEKGVFCTRSLSHRRALSEALVNLASSEVAEPVGISIARPNRRPLSLVLVRLAGTRRGGRSNNQLAVFLSDPEINIPLKTQLFSDLFLLTPVQSSIAALMMQGLSTDRVAVKLGITNNTLREHLKLMFTKVSVRNQGELLHTLLCSPIRFRFPSPPERV